MSKYDSINSATELAAELRAKGLGAAWEDIDRAGIIFRQATVEELAAICIGMAQELDKARQQIGHLEGVVAEWELEAGDRETEDTRREELTANAEEIKRKLAEEIEAHNQTRFSLDITRMRAEAAEKSRDELLVKSTLAHSTPPTLDELRAAVKLLGTASSLVSVLGTTQADEGDFNEVLYFTERVLKNAYNTLAEGFDEGVGTFSDRNTNSSVAE